MEYCVKKRLNPCRKVLCKVPRGRKAMQYVVRYFGKTYRVDNKHVQPIRAIFGGAYKSGMLNLPTLSTFARKTHAQPACRHRRV